MGEAVARRGGVRCPLFPYDIDGDGCCFGRHALGLVAGLIAELCFDEVIAGRGGDVGLDCEVAGVDDEFGVWIGGKDEVRSLWIDCRVEFDTGFRRNAERGWDKGLVFG